MQLPSWSSLSFLGLHPSFEQCTGRTLLHWEKPVPAVTCPQRGTEPLPELWGGCAAGQCKLLLKGLGMVCVSQVASLDSQQPESRWKMGLEMIQLDRCIRDVRCWMQSWWFFWLLGGDSNHNYGSLPPKSFLSGPKGYCSSRFQMSCCFFWITSVLFTVFSVNSSFPLGPSIFSL